MKIWAISDLHLSFSTDKPMDIFGDAWTDYWAAIVADWENKVADEDVVLIAGDISWAMNLEEAAADFAEIAKLKGKKLIIRGNHDYWWSSYSKVKKAIEGSGVYAIQNDCVVLGDYVFAGTRGWNMPTDLSTADDKKIYERELIRLRLSLDAAKKAAAGEKEIIGMIHFPPFNVLFEDSEFTDLFAEFGVKKVVYGHLHGKNCRAKAIVEKGETQYILTSCDQIGNTLISIY